MLIYRRTSLLESQAQTLVNTVNCVGVMGKGIAREFKDREPRMFAAYKRVCDQNLLAPGKLWLWRGTEFWTLNFPTKLHWRNPSKIEWIEAGLQKFVGGHERLGIREISFPRLGCGNGGLDWDEVRPLMERYLSPLPIDVFIHDYTVDIGLPEHMESVKETLRTEQTGDTTFEDFMRSLHRAVDLAGSNLVDLETKRPIVASLVSEHDLKIDAEDTSWTFEPEDLRGVWISLLRGLLTKEQAGWSTTGGGKPLLSILSLLPHVRPIQIQAMTTKAELALEFLPGRRSSAEFTPQSAGQFELTWR